jgi:aspartate/methionine/tyrosine aminotransferase
MLNDRQTLPIPNPEARKFIEHEVARPGTAPDKRFAYYLLAATGICVVPATGFYSPHPGFRVTTLERNPQKLRETYTRLAAAIKEYVS